MFLLLFLDCDFYISKKKIYKIFTIKCVLSCTLLTVTKTLKNLVEN